MPTMIKDPSKLTGQLKKRTARYREVHDQGGETGHSPRPKMLVGGRQNHGVTSNL